MPSIDCIDVIEINASAKKVFDQVADYPSWNQWNPIYYCELIDGDEVEVGAKVHHQFGPKPIILSDFVRRVDEIETNKRIKETYLEGDMNGTGEWSFNEKDGKTQVSYHCKVNSNSLATHVSFVLMGGFAHSFVFQSLLKKLKKQCEN